MKHARGLPAALLAAGAALLCTTARAFDLPDRARIDQWLARLGSDEQPDERRPVDWGVLPGPFYTPETNAGIGMALVGLYRPDRGDMSAPLSSLSLTGFVSLSGAFGFNLDSYTFFRDDQWRLFVNGDAQNLPTYYWGIGYEAGKHNQASSYTARALELHPQLLYRIADASWAGLGWDFSQLQAASPENGSANPIHATADGPNVFVSGFSLHLLHDTRDFIPNPARGQVLGLDLAEYLPALASDERYHDLVLRYGRYWQFDSSDILAFELHGEFASSQVPWNLLPGLGDTQRMRGYYAGRYRDRNALSTQLEWRRQLAWRHGFVIWTGAGTLAPQADELGRHWLPSIGTGYRFLFKPRVNVRLDLGVGRASSGVYFQVGEAF